jgi:uncharacterized protein DUF3592
LRIPGLRFGIHSGLRLATTGREPSDRQTPRRARVLATCIGVALLSAAMSGVCLWQVARELSTRKLASESLGWPSASGDIVDAKLDRSGGRGPSVAATVRYRFVVGTKTFDGQTISFDRPRNAAADDAVRRYPPGTKVRVFFRPGDPSLSVLERDSWTGWRRVVALTVVGIGTAMFAVAMVGVSRNPKT